MKLAELIAYVDSIRPNAYDKDVKTGWVNEIERQAWEQVINRAVPDEGTDTIDYPGPYVYDEHDETTLLIDDSHKDVYVTYLLAQMDYANMEIDRYNVDSAMHQAAWDGYAAEYRRNHLPKTHETPVSPCWYW